MLYSRGQELETDLPGRSDVIYYIAPRKQGRKSKLGFGVESLSTRSLVWSLKFCGWLWGLRLIRAPFALQIYQRIAQHPYNSGLSAEV